jgi:hypothetical protein
MNKSFGDLFISYFISYSFLIVLFLMFLYTFKDPVKSFWFGRRWMFDEQNELSEAIIKQYKIVSVISMVVTAIIFIVITVKSPFISL